MSRTLSLSLIAFAACAPDPVETPEAASQQPFAADAEGLTLAGTLRLPDRTGPVPGVVFVHGSGPNSRVQPMSGQLNMGFGVEIPVFRALSTALQGAGIASYAYDKRTCGPFNGCATNDYPAPPPDLTVGTFIADAAAACTALGAHDAIAEVWIVGHSQGGQLAPAIVQACDAAGGVMLAAPHDPIDALIKAQRDFTLDLLDTLGQPTDTQPIRDLTQLVDDLAALRAGDSPSSATPGGSPVAFWQSWLDASDTAPDIAASLSKPLAAIQGDYDWNVPPAQLDAWRASFDASSAPRTTTLLPCVTHALNCVSQPDFQQITPADIGAEVHADVVEAVLEAIR